jgi:hypothetical protein
MDGLCKSIVLLIWITKIKMDDAPLLRRALRAIGFVDVRSGILPSRSGFCARFAHAAPE